MRGSDLLNLDVGESFLDAVQVVCRQPNGGRLDVLLQAMHLGGARDRYDPGLLHQEPGERDLGGGHPLGRRDRRELIDQRLVRLASFRREAGDDAAEVVLGEGVFSSMVHASRISAIAACFSRAGP